MALIHSPFARASRCALVSLFTVIFVADHVAEAQVQATKQGVLRRIEGWCATALNENARKAIAERGKTAASVCDCFANRMWKEFPSIHFWVYETTPYERNQIDQASGPALVDCIVE